MEEAIEFLKSMGWRVDWVRGGPGLIRPDRATNAEEDQAATFLCGEWDYEIEDFSRPQHDHVRDVE